MSDSVDHPSHYTDGSIEVIDYIEDKNLGFHLGNAVKYISRAGKKNPDKHVEDLEKARWYLDREIGRLRSGAENGPDEAEHEREFVTHAAVDVGSANETNTDSPQYRHAVVPGSYSGADEARHQQLQREARCQG